MYVCVCTESTPVNLRSCLPPPSCAKPQESIIHTVLSWIFEWSAWVSSNRSKIVESHSAGVSGGSIIDSASSRRSCITGVRVQIPSPVRMAKSTEGVPGLRLRLTMPSVRQLQKEMQFVVCLAMAVSDHPGTIENPTTLNSSGKESLPLSECGPRQISLHQALWWRGRAELPAKLLEQWPCPPRHNIQAANML